MSSANYANRGKSLETLIEHANEQYKAKGLALVQKVATPWTVIRRGKAIVSAFPSEKSTVDFIGAMKHLKFTVPIAFDAKECHEKTRFPLANIEKHQINFLWGWEQQGGESFLIIEMTALSKIYKIELKEIMYYWNRADIGGRKSIPIMDFERFKVVGQAEGVVLDYLGLMGR